MDKEIYQLVKNLDRSVLENLSFDEKRVELWQRSVAQWNNTHSPVSTTLEDACQAFKFRWPQIYGSEPLGNSLYLSFSYVDYQFFLNPEGKICGGIMVREGIAAKEQINMTAEQITDLAALLRVVPESLEDWEMDEKTIRECEERTGYLDDTELDGIRQESLSLQMLATSQYMIGMFEESIISITRAIQSFQYFMLEYSRMATPEQVKMFGTSDSTSLAEMYTQLADNLVYTFHYQEAEWCYKLAYRDLRFFEKENWMDYEYMYQPEETRMLEGQDRRCIYLNWAWRIAQLYIKENRRELAIPILEKAEIVADDMNRKEDGRWSANLESITCKIEELKASIHQNHE